jgi:hypothetical protein
MAMTEAIEQASFGRMMKKRTEALAWQIWRKIVKKKRLFTLTGPRMAMLKGALRIL